MLKPENDIPAMRAANAAEEQMGNALDAIKNLRENLQMQLQRTMKDPASALALSEADILDYGRRLRALGTAFDHAGYDLQISIKPEESKS